MPRPIDGGLEPHQINAVIAHICESESNTQGIIEQRVVDCLGWLLFRGHGWRARGIGDAVNASNLSRKKLGDIEFAHIDERRAVALEAHAGHLTRPYVMAHEKSLARLIAQRLADSWAALDDPQNWRVTVMFIAHSWDDLALPKPTRLEGVTVDYEFISYAEFSSRAQREAKTEELVDTFRRLTVNPLNSANVRQAVRDRFEQIAGAP